MRLCWVGGHCGYLARGCLMRHCGVGGHCSYLAWGCLMKRCWVGGYCSYLAWGCLMRLCWVRGHCSYLAWGCLMGLCWVRGHCNYLAWGCLRFSSLAPSGGIWFYFSLLKWILWLAYRCWMPCWQQFLCIDFLDKRGHVLFITTQLKMLH